MSRLRVVLLAVVLFCASCAGIKTLVGEALKVGECVVENTEEFLARPGHQQAAFNAAKIAIEALLAASGGSGNVNINVVDVVRLCTPSGCHAIKM